MANLLKETLYLIEAYGFKTSDVICVAGSDYRFTWAEFEALADVDYDCGFGSAKVAQDLQIIGKTWYMTRTEYDGSEDWQFHKMPSIDLPHHKPKALVVDDVNIIGWASLKEIEEGEKDY